MLEIIHAKQQDIEPLAALFAEGFVQDPLYCHFIPYEQDRPEILRQIFRKYLADYWGELTVLTTSDLAGALCICPDTAVGVERVALPTHIQKVFDQINRVVAPQFYNNYLTLDLLAVRPQMRGQGIARGLVESFCRRVKEGGKQGIVEIYEPANIEFYQKLGFRLTHIQPVGETLSAYLLEI